MTEKAIATPVNKTVLLLDELKPVWQHHPFLATALQQAQELFTHPENFQSSSVAGIKDTIEEVESGSTDGINPPSSLTFLYKLENPDKTPNGALSENYSNHRVFLQIHFKLANTLARNLLPQVEPHVSLVWAQLDPNGYPTPGAESKQYELQIKPGKDEHITILSGKYKEHHIYEENAWINNVLKYAANPGIYSLVPVRIRLTDNTGIDYKIEAKKI